MGKGAKNYYESRLGGLETVTGILMPHADGAKADGMRAYMREQFQFLGIPTPVRRKLLKDFFKQARDQTDVDWQFVNACWENQYREFQYVGADYLAAVQHLLTPSDLTRIRHLSRTKSWWDTADMFARIVGVIVLDHPAAAKTMLKWSTDRDFWVRRVAINHQLLHKEKTNTELLEQTLVNNLDDSEFFINKAIGWALRDYSKTNADWVRSFIAQHGDHMAPLTLREASKYL
jgi:3-methyladenine DNA glycosylase AlkD